MTLFDYNVLLVLVTNNPNWADWSLGHLEKASLAGPLFINDAIYSQLSVRDERIEALDVFIAVGGLEFVRMPCSALFVAGKVFMKCCRAGGTRTGVLPYFSIGAQAAVLRLAVLTRE